MLKFKTEVKCSKMAAMRSMYSWSLHTIEDTWNFWTRIMVFYFVCLYVTKCFKHLIRGLVLIIYFGCLCITKRFKRVIRGLDLVILFCSDCYWCVSPTVWKFGLKLIVRIINCQVSINIFFKVMNLKYDSFNVPQFYLLWLAKPVKSVLRNVSFLCG